MEVHISDFASLLNTRAPPTDGLTQRIPPLLTADLLYILRSMGHGDKLAIVDCNFPASECTTHTTSKKKIELSCDLPTALDAICEVLPLDFFIESPVSYMCPYRCCACRRRKGGDPRRRRSTGTVRASSRPSSSAFPFTMKCERRSLSSKSWRDGRTTTWC